MNKALKYVIAIILATLLSGLSAQNFVDETFAKKIATNFITGNSSKQKGNQGGFVLGRAEKTQGQRSEGSSWDDHTRWTVIEDNTTLRDVWIKRTSIVFWYSF